MQFAQLIQQGWQQHGDDPDGVATQLVDWVDQASSPAEAAQHAALTVHVYGEHLGRFADGDALLCRLLERGAAPDETPEARSIWRSRAILARCAGDEAGEAAHTARGIVPGPNGEAAARVRILAIAASALVGQKRLDEARSTLEEALSHAGYGPDKGDSAAQALAITCNNLSCELETRTDRTEGETELMLLAAREGRRFWEIAGTWTNVERAEYRLSAAHRAAGDGRAALDHARACLGICQANQADGIERFFAHESLALAHHSVGEVEAAGVARAMAASSVDQIEDESMKEFCTGELAKLDKTLAS